MPATPSTKKKSTSIPKVAEHQKYGKKAWGNQLIDLEVPSGELVQVRRPGMQGLIKAGVLHSMDALTGIVQSETIPKAEGKPEVDAQALMKDPDKLALVLDQVDKILLYCVVQPKLVEPFRLDEDDKDGFARDDAGNRIDLPLEEREPDIIYTDYVDIDDKMFIMNFALGGSRDLEAFREESKKALGGIPAGEAAEKPTV